MKFWVKLVQSVMFACAKYLNYRSSGYREVLPQKILSVVVEIPGQYYRWIVKQLGINNLTVSCVVKSLKEIQMTVCY